MIAVSCADPTGQDIETVMVAIRSTHTICSLCTYRRRWQTGQMLISHYAHSFLRRSFSSSSVTYLGVSISSDLSWASHIETVWCKAKWQIGLLRRHFHAGSPSCKSQLYKSLVLPILDYCSSLWDPNYAINKLESVQKLAARFVSGRWNDNYDC